MKAIPRIAIFASGNGSNAQRISEYFSDKTVLEVAAIYCNSPGAYVLERARNLEIPSFLFSRHQFYETRDVLDDIHSREVDWIILAGFLWLIPNYLLKAYPSRIVNIHPALLPKYGGKGMYGRKVHEAVINSCDRESGITIHFVNEEYDNGQVIFQSRCLITPDDTPETLAIKVHKLEYEHYPMVIHELISKTSLRNTIANY